MIGYNYEEGGGKVSYIQLNIKIFKAEKVSRAEKSENFPDSSMLK